MITDTNKLLATYDNNGELKVTSIKFCHCGEAGKILVTSITSALVFNALNIIHMNGKNVNTLTAPSTNILSNLPIGNISPILKLPSPSFVNSSSFLLLLLINPPLIFIQSLPSMAFSKLLIYISPS